MCAAPQNPTGEALGTSEAFLIFSEKLSLAAKVDRPVLIVGERGTGKELAAARLHFLSPRWQEPLAELNCAALAPTLMESELFGHEAGAFTGAAGRKAGRFEAADRGTLFLDEIGLAPLTVQEKILRVVEYGVFERVGGTSPVRVDIRLVAATNADLLSLCREGRFKPDLLDRLSFEVLVTPPLRERDEDIMLLARHFAGAMALELGRDERPVFSSKAEEALATYPWPGNVRELKNVVERAVYRCPGPRVEELDFHPFARAFPQAPAPALPRPAAPDQPAAPPAGEPAGYPLDFKEELLRKERALLAGALSRARFNQRQAAELLGLSYNQFRGVLRKHGGPESLGDKSGSPAV